VPRTALAAATGAALLAGAGLLAGCGVGSATSSAPGVGRQEAVVVRLVDGDTVVLRGRGTGTLRGQDRVRLLLIDTPEVHTRQECFGPEAQQRAAELLPRGGTVTVEPDERLRDRYDRALLHVWTPDGVNVGEALVREGYATVLVVQPNERHLDAFRAAEREARRAGRGLWSACPR
jgi:micrococcal nuclease